MSFCEGTREILAADLDPTSGPPEVKATFFFSLQSSQNLRDKTSEAKRLISRGAVMVRSLVKGVCVYSLYILTFSEGPQFSEAKILLV